MNDVMLIRKSLCCGLAKVMPGFVPLAPKPLLLSPTTPTLMTVLP